MEAGLSGWTERPEPSGGLNLRWGAREAVNVLVDAGADPNAVNPSNGDTPMHGPAFHHIYAYLPFLEALFERGGRVDLPNKKGLCPVDFLYHEDNPKAEALRERFKAHLKQQEAFGGPKR